MADIKEIIKTYVEDKTYVSHSEFTYNYRVEQVGDNDYEVYIVNSFATLVYSFNDVQDNSDEFDPEEIEKYGRQYSAIVGFESCVIDQFVADSVTEYYLDKLNIYIERCELVAQIMHNIDTYTDDRRTYFSV